MLLKLYVFPYRSFGSYFDRQFFFYLGIFITETCSEPPKNLFIFLIWRHSQHWIFTDQIKIRVSDWARPPPPFSAQIRNSWVFFLKGSLTWLLLGADESMLLSSSRFSLDFYHLFTAPLDPLFHLNTLFTILLFVL